MITGGGGTTTVASTGMIALPQSGLTTGAGNAFVAANSADYEAVQVSVGTVVDRILMQIANQSGNIDVGIYDTTGPGGGPGARLTHSGSVACPSAGAAAITIPAVTLSPGPYYAAFACDNGAALFEYAGIANAAYSAGNLRYTQAAAFPLPATATPVANTQGTAYIIVPAKS